MPAAALPETMTAIAITRPGGPEVLVPAERPVPRPGPGQILIAVAAAGVNRPDVFQRLGFYPPPRGAPDTPGLEVAGRVVAAGDGVAWPAPGEAVTALVAGGGYAEYCLADACHALPLPAGLSFLEAASLPETVFTVWSNVFGRAGLKDGESLLVHGGTSGIGVSAIQMAAGLGRTVFATAGSEEKCRFCRALGASRAIDYTRGDYVAEILEATGGRGVDVVLDMVGGDYIARNIALLAPEGRHVSIAFLKGSKVEIDLLPVMVKRLTLTGSTLRARESAFKAEIASSVAAHVWPLLAGGRMRAVIDSTFPLAEAAAAHARIEAPDHVGKVMLAVTAEADSRPA
ncbi:MAG: NAD(P)H-quinone oxidoreductase [Alphaproteobacteria bacterium]|nr:NAD(P)H-quinone oxidoreductase [Alphaproteobacteria bacterium]